MWERLLGDLIEVAIWSQASHRKANINPQMLALPSPDVLKAEFQIPPRGHYEPNATLFQKRKLEKLGGTNWEVIDALGREQADYLVQYIELMALAEAKQEQRIEAERRRQQRQSAILTFFCVVITIIIALLLVQRLGENREVATKGRQSNVPTTISTPKLPLASKLSTPPTGAFTSSEIPIPPLTPSSPSFSAGVKVSQIAAARRYPELSIEGSKMNVRFLAHFHEWQVRHDLRLNRSDWPEKLADECALLP